MFKALLAMPLAVTAHMGISSPVPWDAALGDAFRNPNPPSICHGQSEGGDALSGKTTLKMTFGAAHNGGVCAVFYCPQVPPLPTNCEREKIMPVEGCTKLFETQDCTKKGSMTEFDAVESTGIYLWYWNPGFNSGQCEIYHNCFTAKGPGVVTIPPTPPPTPANIAPTNPPTFDPNATPGKIRCGLTWNDAAAKCGTFCKSDVDCPVANEGCFAALPICAVPDPSSPGGPPQTPAVPIVRPIGVVPSTCVSTRSYISDQWCRSVACGDIYGAYCSKYPGSISAESPKLTIKTCVIYATELGDRWEDIRNDVEFEGTTQELKHANPWINPATSSFEANVILEIPGDCQAARYEVENAAARAGTTIAIAASLIGSAVMCAM